MILQVKDLHFRFNGVDTVHNFHLQVEKGEMVGLWGPIGAGKSTLLRCLDGILKPRCSILLLDGKDLRKMNRRLIAKRKLETWRWWK